jgi:DNA polymerase elongation subunit (family B)
MEKYIETSFFAFHWTSYTDESNNEAPTEIHINGCDELGNRVYVNVKDFYYSLLVELPNEIVWDKQNIKIMTSEIKKVYSSCKYYEEPEFILQQKLYYAHLVKTEENTYTHKKFPYIRVKFRNKKDFNIFKSNIKKEREYGRFGKSILKVHEIENVEIFIKLQALKKLPNAGMILVKGKQLLNDKKKTEVEIEIETSYKNIEPIVSDKILNPNLLCFDIETFSSKAIETGRNCFPKTDNPKDKIFQIACILNTFEVKEKKILLSLGEPDLEIVGKDVEIRCFENEGDLICGFKDIIKEFKIQKIIGYNILGYDMNALIKRAIFNKIYTDFSLMGIDGKPGKIIEPETEFKTKAYSAQKLIYLDCEGLLYIDILPVVKRSVKAKNYRLNTITTHFGLPSKKDLKPMQIFKCFDKFSSESLGKCGHYCVNDAWITYLLYNKIQCWVGLCEMAKTAMVPVFYLFSKGTQIQLFSQVTAYCYEHKITMVSNGYTPKENDEYAGAIVLTPIPGRYKKVLSFDFASLYPSIMRAYNIDYSTFIDEGDHLLIDKFVNDYHKVWTSFPAYVKLSIPLSYKKDNVPIEEWIKIYDTKDLTQAVEKFRKEHPDVIIGIFKNKSEIPDCDTHIFSWSDHTNCCHDENRKRLKNGEFSKSKKKIICGQRYYRFIKQNVAGQGVVPILLENHINSRKITRNQIKINDKEILDTLCRLYKNQNPEITKFLTTFEQEEKGYFEDLTEKAEKYSIEDLSSSYKNLIERIYDLVKLNVVLDGRQLAKKVCANSAYGAMGVKKGYLPLGPGAASTTYRGREAIKFISTYIPQNYDGKTVYGDTDSSHIFFPNFTTNKQLIELAEKVTKKMEEFFPFPMKLEFEKIYEDYIILTKKRYMARVSNLKGEIIDFSTRGIVLSRRDNCKILLSIYKELADRLLNHESCDTILNVVNDYINKMFTCFFDSSYFVISKGLTNNPNEYKGKTLPAHVSLALKLRKRGIDIGAGARLEYVLLRNKELCKDVKQGEIVEDFDYFTEMKEYFNLDLLYYFEKQLIKPVDELLEVVLGVKDYLKKNYKYRVFHRKMILELEKTFKEKIVFEDEKENQKKEEKEEKEDEKEEKKKNEKPIKEKKKKSDTTILEFYQKKPIINFDEETERIKKEIEEAKKKMNYS